MKRLRFYWRARKFLRKWDRAEIRAMLDILQPGDVALDVGCHKGGWLYWMRRAVGPGGQVHAFEPQPELHAYLADIVQTFGWKNVFIHPHALGSETGRSTLHVPDSTGTTSASASLVPEVALNETNLPPSAHPVDVSTLDNFVQAQGLDRVDFIKIDVEGFEAEALSGAQQTLKHLRPTIMVECEGRHLRASARTPQQVFDLVLQHTYKGQFFPQGQQTPIESFNPALHQNEQGERFWDRETYANNFLFEPQ